MSDYTTLPETVPASAVLERLRGEKPARSAWGRAVQDDAYTLVEDLAGDMPDLPTDLGDLTEALLDGATDWRSYSWGGCALCYDSDIARHYCTPSELERSRHGARRPNRREEWLDVQARALSQAARHVRATVRAVAREAR